nr:hypothetical protein [uncultured Pseudogulbenkiania sp.]
MKSPRGAANILRYNAERVDRYIPLIKGELKKCRRHKINFTSVGKLAQYIGDLTGIHRTTLTRNTQYKKLLIDHIVSQGGSITNVPDNEAPPEILRAKLLAARLESSNLREKVKRLEASFPNQGSLSALKQEREDALREDDYLAFVDTAMALTAVLERIQDTVLVDLTKKTIEDLAAPPSKRVIVGPERAAAYISWLSQQQGLFSHFIGVKSGENERT